MTDPVAPDVSETTPLPVAAAPEASFGRLLAAQRQRLGLSVNEIAARLRLHPRQIDAIEQEVLERLPKGPFVRGFVRNYAKELKLDPEPLLEDLRRHLAGSDEEGGNAAAQTRAPAGAVSPMFRIALAEQISRPVVITVVLVLLIALAIIGSLSTRDGAENTVAEAPRSAVPAAPPLPAPAPNGAAAPPQEGAPAGTPGTETATTSGAAVPAPSAVGEAASPGPAPATTTSPPTAIEKRGPAVSSNTLRLRFTDESWVEVTQSDGRILLSQLNAPGTEQRLEGKPPLKLVIGNAQGVALEFRGKPIDLAPRTNSENVARLTLD